MNFQIAIQRVLDNEGGYVFDPRDPGGETNFGISKRSYPDVDIKGLTREQASAIYRKDFWDPLDAETFPLSMSFQLLDFAVNAGIGTAIRKAQTALGIADDGRWGPISQAAMHAVDPAQFTILFAVAKLRFYTKLSTWPAFGAGWINRVAADLELAASDIKGDV